jgi:polysaccharide pyruvyl transferase WcaK-like protein
LPASVTLFARDPVSKERLERYLQRPVTLTADIAFLLEPRSGGQVSTEVLGWIKQQQDQNAIVVGINANHVLIEKYPELSVERLVKAYQVAIQDIYNRFPEVGFLFIPHDIRGEASDVVSKIVPLPCPTAEIKYIVSKLAFVLSGKMHLAIACLSQGIPVACIAYQDKFEGLFQHFEMENMTMAPEELLEPGKLSQFFIERFMKRQELAKQIQTHLPKVIELAEKNLSW